MKASSPALLLPACFLLCFGTFQAAADELPGPVVPEGIGVNIHFTDHQPGEMEMLAQAGFKWVRMDFAWNATERGKGVYDFSAYDRLLAVLEAHKIRAMLILDYSNPQYNEGLSPASDEGLLLQLRHEQDYRSMC
jgi:polysaccharide biosynthesis protein PslG